MEKKFPSKWLEMHTIPLLKPGKNKENADSYRPTALTCTMCKTLERIINNRLQWHLDKHNIITPSQSGFRKNRSTLDNIDGWYEY